MKCHSIKILDISKNKLTDIFPNNIKLPKKLICLNAMANNIHAFPKKLKKLQFLFLGSNK